MFCKNCGTKLESGQAFCPACGAPAEYSAPPQNTTVDNDTGAAGFGVLGFFFPLIGLILYLVWKNEYPKRAKASGKGALIGFILYVIIVIIWVIVLVSAINATTDYYSAFSLLSMLS